MKKKVYMAVLTLAFAGLFAGCGKKAEDPGVSVKDDVVEFVNVELPAAKTDHDNAIAIYNAYFADTGSQDFDTFKTSLQDTAIPEMENCITTISNIEVIRSTHQYGSLSLPAAIAIDNSEMPS